MQEVETEARYARAELMMQTSAVLLTAYSQRRPLEPQAPVMLGGMSYPFNHSSVVRDLFALARQVHPNAHEYDLIIGEDTSGRLPALVLRGVINARRQALGLEKSAIRFICGTRVEPVPERVIPPQRSDASRALIVTECVDSGDSIVRVYKGLSQHWPASRIDIAAAGGRYHAMHRCAQEALAAVVRRYSASGDGVDYLHGCRVHDQKGVHKVAGDCFSSRQYPEVFRPLTVRKARRDAALIAEMFARALSRNFW